MRYDSRVPIPSQIRRRSRRVRTPQQARSRRTRERILEAAVASFEERGYDETTTAAIARDADIGVGTLYAYFRDKHQILLELADRTVKELSEFVIDALQPQNWRGTDPRELTRSIIDVIFHTQKLRPGLQRVMWERFFKDPEFREPQEAIHQNTKRAVAAFLEAVERDGLLRRPLDLATAASVVVHAVQWNATRAMMDGDAQQVDAAAAATSEMISRFLFVDPIDPST